MFLSARRLFPRSFLKHALLRSILASAGGATALLIGLAPILHAQTDGLEKINHIVVIYQENWSFDSLYGKFPGANGLAQSSSTSLNQTDRFDQPLSAQTGQ